MNQLHYKYEHLPNSHRSFLILPGLNGGYSSDLMTMVFNGCASRGTTLAIDYPYYHRPGDRPTQGLIEEQAALRSAYEYIRAQSPNSILTITGKSIGGIIISNWLESETKDSKLQIALLAYDKGEENMKAAPFKGRLAVVIQGELDEYGDSAAIKQELSAHGVEAKVVGIPNADHSYRCHEAEAIDHLFHELDIITV